MPGPHRIVVIRHGQTEWSASGRHTGRTDVALTAEGVAQAERLRPVFAVRSFAVVLSSPLRRAAETAALAGVGDHEQVLVDERLVEWDYGQYEGLTTSEIRAEVPGWTVWTHRCPGGETSAEVGARVDAVLERCRGIDGDVLLVAHGHLLRVLTARWLGLAPTDGRFFLLDPAAAGELGHEHGSPAIAHWNLDPSLVSPPV